MEEWVCAACGIEEPTTVATYLDGISGATAAHIDARTSAQYVEVLCGGCELRLWHIC
ncbi:hypothetical protein B0F90DRAFT_1681112, partial [Multifurca ochricompacta]